jgi:hypothetical protein
MSLASRTFQNQQSLEKNVKELYTKFTMRALTPATAMLDLTADIVLTSVSDLDSRNGTTFEIVVNAPAANPTDTVLLAFTGTASAIVCTVTPNDGTNNTATPVTVTTADLAEAITTGAITGKTATITDASSLRALQTATGGDTTPLAQGGEGDGVSATFAGADSSPSIDSGCNVGFASVTRTAVGTFEILLEDAYVSLKDVQPVLIASSAADIQFQVKSETVATDKTVTLITRAGATPTDPATGAKVMVKLELKNTDVA